MQIFVARHKRKKHEHMGRKQQKMPIAFILIVTCSLYYRKMLGYRLERSLTYKLCQKKR